MQKIIKFINSHIGWSLFVIIFIALILRVILIDKIPGGLQGDESLIVYNAWSIAETGADVLNDHLPIQLRGYGWGENSFLVYLLVFVIKIFGPFNVTIFRLLIVFFHLLLILFSFLLARELFDERVGLLTALFLTFSPWDLVLSRILFNVSILPCLYIAGLYFLIKGIRNKKLYNFIISGFIFSLTFYIYALSFLWIPLILLIITVAFWSEIRQLKPRHYLTFTVLVLLLSLPIFLFYVKNQFGLLANINQVFAFALPKLSVTRFDTISIFNEANKSVLLIVIKNYFSHLNPIFLFFNATLPCFVKYFGLIQLYELPFIILGLVLILIKSQPASHKFIIFWLLAAPLPAALTIENIPHPLRFVSALPVFEIIA
ncbi:MAG: glycosyltransferase family 39 protein, partial [Candidatus Parcubacteria bacterium]|nr:glycosyltransferase family 39 protein [Candidatus Parcubacteria bacterium]